MTFLIEFCQKEIHELKKRSFAPWCIWGILCDVSQFWWEHLYVKHFHQLQTSKSICWIRRAVEVKTTQHCARFRNYKVQTGGSRQNRVGTGIKGTRSRTVKTRPKLTSWKRGGDQTRRPDYAETIHLIQNDLLSLSANLNQPYCLTKAQLKKVFIFFFREIFVFVKLPWRKERSWIRMMCI